MQSPKDVKRGPRSRVRVRVIQYPLSIYPLFLLRYVVRDEPPMAARSAIAFLFFHHIRSPQKRKLIAQLARDSGISGACKIGRPGFLLIEGEEYAVQDYLKALKQMRWHIIEIRKLLVTEGGLQRHFGAGMGVREVSEGSGFSAIVREARLESFLQQAMVGR